VVDQTTGTAFTPPVPLQDGLHSWQVTAANPVGVTTATRVASFWVDTAAPVVKLSLTRKFQVGYHIHAYATYTDAPPPEPAAGSSGIAGVLLNWGDGTVQRITHSQYHAYLRAGRYRVTVYVADRAGNVGSASMLVRVAPKPKPRPKPKPKRRARRKPASSGHHASALVASAVCPRWLSPPCA
jgi:hypothetical protein